MVFAFKKKLVLIMYIKTIMCIKRRLLGSLLLLKFSKHTLLPCKMKLFLVTTMIILHCQQDKVTEAFGKCPVDCFLTNSTINCCITVTFTFFT